MGHCKAHLLVGVLVHLSGHRRKEPREDIIASGLQGSLLPLAQQCASSIIAHSEGLPMLSGTFIPRPSYIPLLFFPSFPAAFPSQGLTAQTVQDAGQGRWQISVLPIPFLYRQTVYYGLPHDHAPNSPGWMLIPFLRLVCASPIIMSSSIATQRYINTTLNNSSGHGSDFIWRAQVQIDLSHGTCESGCLINLDGVQQIDDCCTPETSWSRGRNSKHQFAA